MMHDNWTDTHSKEILKQVVKHYCPKCGSEMIYESGYEPEDNTMGPTAFWECWYCDSCGHEEKVKP